MEKPRTKLVEEENTIYEIDLDCMRKKAVRCKPERTEKRKKRRAQQSSNTDFP